MLLWDRIKLLGWRRLPNNLPEFWNEDFDNVYQYYEGVILHELPIHV